MKLIICNIFLDNLIFLIDQHLNNWFQVIIGIQVWYFLGLFCVAIYSSCDLVILFIFKVIDGLVVV